MLSVPFPISSVIVVLGWANQVSRRWRAKFSDILIQAQLPPLKDLL